MKLIYKIILVTGLIWGVGAKVLVAKNGTYYQKKDFTKTIKKEYEISIDGLVKLSNRYGKVDLNTWEKDRVKIEVKITVRASSEKLAQNDFDRIEIHFANSPSLVSAETEIIANSSNTSWWGGWDSSDYKSDFSIDYQVYMPASCDLELSNKYGDARISSISGNTRLNIKYGDFEFAGTEGDLDVYLGYGNGQIDAVGDLSADGAYCSLKVGKADDIQINSKYSKIEIEEAQEIHSHSKYDSYRIQKVVNLRNEGKYDNFNVGIIKDLMVISKHTDLNVDRLTNSANFELKYGGARVSDVAKGFTKIILIGNHADYKINVEDGANYQVQAETDNSGVKCHRDFKFSDKMQNKGSTEVNGYMGKKNAQSLIKAQLNYGGLKVW